MTEAMVSRSGLAGALGHVIDAVVALAVQMEREACAREAASMTCSNSLLEPCCHAHALAIAAAIRARGAVPDKVGTA